MSLGLLTDDDDDDGGALSLQTESDMRQSMRDLNSPEWDDVARFLRRIHVICMDIERPFSSFSQGT